MGSEMRAEAGGPEGRTLRVGQVARAAGVRPDTVRYYEREGLLAPAPRRPSGYRAFPPDAVRRIRFIKRAQELGFTLQEIRELLELEARDETECAPVLEIARRKAARVREKIADLETILEALEELIHACTHRRAGLRCPILDRLERNGAGASSERSASRRGARPARPPRARRSERPIERKRR
jgi:Hg(II)-responsive transcriptional regulator